MFQIVQHKVHHKLEVVNHFGILSSRWINLMHISYPDWFYCIDESKKVVSAHINIMNEQALFTNQGPTLLTLKGF